MPHLGKCKSHQKWPDKFKLFTIRLHQVNSELVSSEFQQDQKQCKDKKLTTEINTNFSNTFSCICRKIKIKVEHHLDFGSTCGKIS